MVLTYPGPPVLASWRTPETIRRGPDVFPQPFTRTLDCSAEIAVELPGGEAEPVVFGAARIMRT